MNATSVEVLGYVQRPQIPVEDYQDFEHVQMDLEQVKSMLSFGHFPPGLVIQDHTGRYIVVGLYERRQKLSRFHPLAKYERYHA